MGGVTAIPPQPAEDLPLGGPVPLWILDETVCGVRLSGAELRTYAALRIFVHGSGNSRPAVRQVADLARVTAASVERAVRRLRAADLLRTRRLYRADGSIRGCEYRFRNVPPGAPDPGLEFPLEHGNAVPRGVERCAYCGTGSAGLVVDHILPRSRGGLNGVDNRAPSCPPCNSEKGALTPEEWRDQRLQAGLPWPPVQRRAVVVDGVWLWAEQT